MSQGQTKDPDEYFRLMTALRAFRTGQLDGDPSDRALARAARISPDTLGHWLAGDRFPKVEDKLLAVIQTLAARCRARGIVPDHAAGLLDESRWRRAYRAEVRRRAAAVSTAVQGATAARTLAGLPSGWPAGEIPSSSAPSVLRGLPRQSPVFTGREADLTKLLALLGPGGPAAGQPPAAVVTGPPGVGKTELTLHAAHAALEKGWFPGGALFIDMFGYEDKRMVTATAALESLLRAVGTPAESIPASEQDRSHLFASVLAQYADDGKPVLVVVDNVSTSTQVRPLIPATGTVVVTSRHLLPLPGAQPVELKQLSDAAGVELLAAQLGLRPDGDTRVASQPDDATAIARLCGGFPLALQIVAALLVAHPARSLSTMAANLEGGRSRLDEMAYSEPDGSGPAVRAAFDLSHRQLNAAQSRLFRLLPLNRGPDVSTAAMAAMASLDERTTRRLLDELARAHLIETGGADGTTDGRWRMHDLLREYARGLGLLAKDKPGAVLLLLAYYAETVSAATRHLDPPAVPRPGGPFTGRAEALAWLDAEYPNLIQFGDVILMTKPQILSPFTTADLFLHLWRYFELRHLTDDWIRFTKFALLVAQGLNDRPREGEALSKLSGALRQARQFDEAADACRDAIDIERALGDRAAEGIALNNLAGALLGAGRYDEAIIPAREAAALFRNTGDRHREGIAVSHLGSALADSGQLTEGVAALEEAAGIFREVGDPRGESGALTNLANALSRSGREPDEVIDLHRQSAASMAQAGDQHGQGMAFVNLSASLFQAGDLDGAIAAAGDAATLLRDADDPHGLGGALVNLGMALLGADQASEAAEALGDAVTAYQRSGDQDAEANTRIRLGDALELAGNREAAIATFRDTADLCREAANHRREGEALGQLGHALWEARQRKEAIATLRTAVTVSRAAGDLESEAKALAFLGIALPFNQVDDAIAAFRASAELCRRAGSGDLAELASGVVQATEAAKHARDELAARLAAGRFGEVIADYRAFSVRVTGDRYVVAGMAAELGGSLSRAGRFGQAIPVLEEAVAAFREADDPDQENAARAELSAARQAQLAARAAADALGSALRMAVADGRALRATFDEAKRHLGACDARLFYLLSALPGPDFSLPAATILAVAERNVILARLEELSGLTMGRKHRELARRISGLYRADLKVARDAIGVLTQMRLVERDPADSDRWRLPAAIRSFAAQQDNEHVEQDLRGPVQMLLRIYYLAGAQAASASLQSGGIAPALDEMQTEGLHWLDAEYPSLVAAVRQAADDDLEMVIALDVTRSLFPFMGLRRRFDDSIALSTIARRGARRLHDRHAEAAVLCHLGSALTRARRQDEAINALRDALGIYQDLGDLGGEGTARTGLGGALTQRGQFAQADTELRTAIGLHHQSGDRLGEAMALASLGVLLNTTGQAAEAITALKNADRVYREVRDHYHRAQALAQLADALRSAGHGDEAIKAYRKAATLARVTGDRPGAAAALARLAEAYRAAGQLAEADDVLQEAAQITSESDDIFARKTEFD
jgi:tetratricopeptide (TPR) repeat protein